MLSTALFLLLLAPAGCDTGKTKEELVILCGNSFIPPMEKLCDLFKEKTGISATTTTGGSEDLLPQIQAARKGDIFITHDPYLDLVQEAGFLAGHAEVGFVAPVLAVQKGNPKGLQKIEDLVRPGLRVALTDPKYSTCGEMVFALLDKKGIKARVLENVGNRLTKGHPKLGTFLETDAVDAVVMWNGVANTFQAKLDVLKTPYEYDTEIRVHVIGLSCSEKPELVQQFLDLAKTEGARIFSSHGYVK